LNGRGDLAINSTKMGNSPRQQPSFGVKFRAAREKAGLSQQAVADLTRSTQKYISLVETGEQSPKETRMIRMAAAIGKRLLIELIDC